MQNDFFSVDWAELGTTFTNLFEYSSVLENLTYKHHHEQNNVINTNVKTMHGYLDLVKVSEEL